MQCSFIGDAANLASRIEELTKLYRARVLISEYTFRRLDARDAFAIRMIDRVAVKGKETGVQLYEVIDAEEPRRRTVKLATRALLHSAMEKYFDRDFKAAQAAFKETCSEAPDDPVPVLFVERCARYLRDPPPDNWNGVEQLTQK